MRRSLLILLLFAATAAVALLGMRAFGRWPVAEAVPAVAIEKVSLATPAIPASALLFVARRQGLFAKHGLDVTLVRVPTGKAALAAMLSGQADIAAVASLPISMAINAGNRSFGVLATIATVDTEHGIVARRDRGIRSIPDLQGKRIAVPVGTTAHLYLDSVLLDAGVPAAKVEIVDRAPDDALRDLIEMRVDAAAQFSPWIEQAAAKLGASGITFSPPGYSLQWNLACGKAFVEARAGTAEKLLRALFEAEELVRRQAQPALDQLAEEQGFVRENLAKRWRDYRFRVHLSQALIVTLEDEVRWAARRGDGAAAGMPDFLDHLYALPLSKVRPETVKVTR